MRKKIVIYIFIIFFILISIGFGIVFAATNNSEKDVKELKDKAIEEIDLLEDKIISMMNKLNNINFSNTILIEEKTNNNEKKTNEQNEESFAKNEQSQGGSNSSTDSSNENSQNSSNRTSSENIKYEVKNNGILGNDFNSSVDWEYLKINIETIHTIIPTIIADLNSLNVNSEDILKFNTILDEVTLDIKNEDKISTLNNLASLYGTLPIYESQFLGNLQKINILYCKNSILNSYALIEQNNWQEVKNQITNAINYFTNVLDDVNENTQNQNRISKIYILLNELNSTIDLQDKELFYIKYRNTMEELINI